MTAVDTVTITAPCPTCHHDATWTGTLTKTGHGTSYEIDCSRCDADMTVRAQYQRWLNRTTSETPHPIQLAPSAAIAALRRNPLWRIFTRGRNAA